LPLGSARLNALITDEGRELFATARRTQVAGVHERFLGRFSREELRTLVALWERLQPGAGHGDC